MKNGLKLKIKRIEKGISQEDLAISVGVTPQMVSLYERGIRLPRPENMKKISELLEVSVQELFFDE